MGDLATVRPLPNSWVDKLFQELYVCYGKTFLDMWPDLEAAKAGWALKLADLSGEELRRGYLALTNRKWPPTLPEFRDMCRPALDPESAFSEAAMQMALRDQGRDQWSHPAVYWAAATIGAFDMRNLSWSAIKPRWVRVLQAELAKGEWPAVPPRLDALPAPGAIQADPARVREIMDKSRNRVSRNGDTQWAHDVEARAAAGESLPMLLREMAEEALGHPIERHAPAHRPDHADRAAGDDSFEDEPEPVPL